MMISRRTLIKTAPLLAAPMAGGATLMNGNSRLIGISPLVVFERDDEISARFAASFPAHLQRFEIRDNGALQFQHITEIVANTSKPIIGLTGSAIFLLFVRLVADYGRKFIVTGIHEPCRGGGNVHGTRAGLASSPIRELSDHNTWVEALGNCYLAMCVANNSLERATPIEPEKNLAGTLSQPAHSWLIG